jgi:hypothetical protein
MLFPSPATIEASIRALPSLEAVRDWLEGRVPLPAWASSSSIRALAVSRGSRFFDEALVRHTCRQGGAYSNLLGNPDVPVELLPVLLEECTRAITEWAVDADWEKQPQQAAKALPTLAERGIFTAMRPEAETLLALATRTGAGSASMTVENVVRAFAIAPDTPNEAAALLCRHQHWPKLRLQLLTHPNSQYEQWREVLSRDWDLSSLQALAEHAEARKRPDIRQAIIAFGLNRDLTLLGPLLRDGLDDFRWLALTLLEREPAIAALELPDAPAHRLAELHAHELLPLLRSSDAETRLAGIALQNRLSRTGPTKEAAPPQAPTTARRDTGASL